VYKGVKTGVMLFPEETRILKRLAKKYGVEVEIVPQVGYGIKGKSRPRPEIIGLYQMVNESCPFLETETNRCRIYKLRPTSCRAYPLALIGSIMLITPIAEVPHAMVGFDEKCPKIPTLLEKLRVRGYDRGMSVPSKEIKELGLTEEWDAVVKISRYKELMTVKYSFLVWVYDFEKGKWIRRSW